MLGIPPALFPAELLPPLSFSPDPPLAAELSAVDEDELGAAADDPWWLLLLWGSELEAEAALADDEARTSSSATLFKVPDGTEINREDDGEG